MISRKSLIPANDKSNCCHSACMYDLTVTAALRAQMVDTCLTAAKNHVSRPPRRVYVNIDPAGPDSSEDVLTAIMDHYPDAHIRMPETPDFPLAVKWLWQSARSDYVLHVEDSKELTHAVDMKQMIAALQDLAAVSLKFANPEDCPERPQRRSDGLWETPWYGKAVCLQPTVWRREVISRLAGWMQSGISPEKTIRPGRYTPVFDELNAYMGQFRYGFVTDTNRKFWFNRHGANWRHRYGYRKNGKKGIDRTWLKR